MVVGIGVDTRCMCGCGCSGDSSGDGGLVSFEVAFGLEGFEAEGVAGVREGEILLLERQVLFLELRYLLDLLSYAANMTIECKNNEYMKTNNLTCSCKQVLSKAKRNLPFV